MDLILWRHAQAVDGGPDLARELTPLGHKQAQRMGRWLAKRLAEPTRTLVSPAVRALQTAAALSLNFEVDDRLAPGAQVRDVLAAATWPDGTGTVLLVGHQPTLGWVVSQLLNEAGADWPIKEWPMTDWPIKKGAIVWLRRRVRGDSAQIVLRAAVSPDLV